MACRKMNEDFAYARNTESGCNFGGSLVLDFRQWQLHVQLKNIVFKLKRYLKLLAGQKEERVGEGREGGLMEQLLAEGGWSDQFVTPVLSLGRERDQLSIYWISGDFRRFTKILIIFRVSVLILFTIT